LNDPAFQSRVEEGLARVIRWVQEHRYLAYEPADGNSSVLFPLTGGRVWPMRVLQQVVLRSPVNIRPLLGVRPHESAIGRGYMAWAYLTMCRTGASSDIRDEAVACLAWLMANRARGFDEFCWGDPYEYATRGGRRPLGAPILIWTALIGQAFLEAFAVLGDRRYLGVAESVGRWIRHLPIEHTASGSCLSYNAYMQSSIHNSNAMGAAFLARLGAATGDQACLSLARSAMTYTCARQHSDGAWFYGEAPKYHWVDNFHTGYNISALKVYRDAVQDDAFHEQYARGIAYFKANFFDADGRPKYFHDKTYPVDIQCAAQAIDTLVAVSAEDPDSLPLAYKVADWTLNQMQAPDGHFHYRQLPSMTVRTPMLHWGQGTMAKALAVLLRKLADEGSVSDVVSLPFTTTEGATCHR
jgi:rhamnogalacturonyl hydrolase YesR